MSAELQLPLVLVKTIERPSFDHTNYHSFARWTAENIDKLEDYFVAQQQTLGDGELTDFVRWCACQHDICEGEAARANERYNRGCSL